MLALPLSQIGLLLLALLVYLGVMERVLDRMRLTDRAAMVIIALMLVSSFLPAIDLGLVELNIGGAVIPIAICLYLLITADEIKEKIRAIGASVMAALGIIIFDKVLPIEPGALIYDIDPLFVPAIIAGGIAYGLGRSRRAAFIAGIFGVVLSDLAAVSENILRGATGVGVVIGGAGMVDAVLVAGVFAVVLAEVTGEIAEVLSRRTNHERPGLLKEVLKRLELTSAAGVGGNRGRTLWWAMATIVFSLTLILAGPSLLNMSANIDELEPGSYFTMVDQDNQIIAKTGRRIFTGDEYITSDNKLYRVENIVDTTAKMVFVEEVDLLAHLQEEEVVPAATGGSSSFGQTNLTERIFYFGRRNMPDADDILDSPEGTQGQSGEPVGRIGIYHTHNAESYVPSDGSYSIYGKGGIHQVGESFADSLRENNLEVFFSQNLHLPHDRGAYRRSRRTVTRLMQEDLDMVFDVHRDAAPAHVYAEEVNETWVTQILLVVGRQNQNLKANQNFAKELKAIGDQKAPGLIQGILIARGNYNQDLFTRALLLEVGSHTNARESAERGIAKFAPIIRAYLDGVAEEAEGEE